MKKYILLITLTCVYIGISPREVLSEKVTSQVRLIGIERQDVSNKIEVELKVTGKTKPLVFGHNLLAFDSCLRKKAKSGCVNVGRNTNYASGFWDPYRNQTNGKVLRIAKEVNITSLRFPGGGGAELYDWKRGIGPVEKRPLYQFGIDEFMMLCDKLNAEPIITLNFSTKDRKDLIHMVEYLNKSVGESNLSDQENWAKRRSKYGHLETYGVKYFEFGNEVYGRKDISPEDYAHAYLDIRSKIKEVDKSAHIGAVMVGNTFQAHVWDRGVASIIGNQMDFAIVHVYPLRYREDSSRLDAQSLFRIALASPLQIHDQLMMLDSRLRFFTGRKIPVFVTEYNGNFVQERPVPYRHSLGNALLNAELLRVFLESGVVTGANYWEFVNSYWSTVYNHSFMEGRGRYHKRPNYFVYDFYGNHFGSKLLKTKVECGDYRIETYADIKATGRISNEQRKQIEVEYPKEILHVKSTDWRILKCSGATTVNNHEGITINFTGDEDVNYSHARIDQQVNPGHVYRLKCWMKSDGLGPSSGGRIEVFDSRGWKQKPWARSTDEVIRDMDWIPRLIEFKVPEDTHSITIAVRRFKGYKITGEFSVRSLKLEDLGPEDRYPATPFLSAIASTNKDMNKVYLIVVNKKMDGFLATRIVLKGFRADADGKSRVLFGSSIDSTNEDYQENVQVENNNIVFRDGGEEFFFNFPPHSLTAFELPGLTIDK